MFNRRKHSPKPLQIDTLIGANTRINGDLQFSGGLHVDGAIEGNISAEENSGSKLSISDSGKVHGSIRVPSVVLNGLVQGDIVAQTRVDLGTTAQVNGDVYYGLIEMAMGAQINGKLIHQTAAVSDIKTKEPAQEPLGDVAAVEIGTVEPKVG